MVIAFVVLAIVALIFLFVYNSRLTKKSKGAESNREEPDVSPAPPAAPEALPPVQEVTAAPQVTPVQVDAPHVAETRNDVRNDGAKVIAPEASDRTALMEAEAEAHRSASDGDRAYREALRKFAVQPPAAQEKEQAPAKRPDPSSDDAYREALRSMMKDQKK
ncbi:hypothetical protein ACTHPF_16930 [Paenibacillus sp. SAF-054]|uniref:hypothetical protein n=1 Tax=unclassified Paenibacillus TaxID=185978 RepID=UPI003F7D2C90